MYDAYVCKIQTTSNLERLAQSKMWLIQQMFKLSTVFKQGRLSGVTVNRTGPEMSGYFASMTATSRSKA